VPHDVSLDHPAPAADTAPAGDTARPAARPGNRAAAGVVLAVVGGAGIAVQSRVNGSLADHVGSGYLAAVVSFGSGLILLTLALLVSRRSRAGMRRVLAALRDGGLRPWQVLGGAAGGFFVATQGLTVGVLGVATFIVAFVTGQSVGSVVIDRLGLGPGGVRLVTFPRAVGPVLTVAAVAIAMSGGLGSPSALLLAVLPLVAGIGSAWQQAVNGHVRAAAGDVLAATLVNFVVGTVVLAAALGVSLLAEGLPDGAFPADPLLYTGGIIGIAFIALSAAVVHRIGVLLLSLGMIAGQIVTALVLDAVAPGATPPGVATYVGAALTLVGVAVPLLAERRRHT
jgi:transporter family-2 protein